MSIWAAKARREALQLLYHIQVLYCTTFPPLGVQRFGGGPARHPRRSTAELKAAATRLERTHQRFHIGYSTPIGKGKPQTYSRPVYI